MLSCSTEGVRVLLDDYEDAEDSGEKTKALPTLLPAPRETMIACPAGHSPSRITSKIRRRAARTSFSLRGGSERRRGRTRGQGRALHGDWTPS